MSEAAGHERVQLHLVLPYKFEPRAHRTVRRYLERGYRVVQLQRVSDREALVTLAPGEPGPPGPPGSTGAAGAPGE
jgi:hypothetical protein